MGNNQLILILVFIILLVAAGPVLVIWSWNVLFGTVHTIPYTFSSWAAVVILAGLLQARVKVDKD